MRTHVVLVVLIGLLLGGVPRVAAQEDYLTGGPLAGVKLPSYRTQHGEEPGHPGCIPELMNQGKAVRDMGNEYVEWGKQGLSPEWDLYDGSVEHWRAYMFKYLPIRSFFDRQSQIKNFVAPDIPGATPADIEQYAEPVYWVPRHAPVKFTGRYNKPVPVVRWKVGGPVFDLDLGELPVSMYAVRVIAAVETDKLRTFRRPVFLRFRVNDGNDGSESEYKVRIGYCDEFYSVAELYFNAPARRRYRARLWVDQGSEVDLLVHNISLDDVLAGATRKAVKKRVSLAPDAKRPTPTNPRYTPEERQARDAAIWNYLPPLNHQGSGNTFRQASYNAIFHPDVRFGADGMDRAEVEKKFGAWKPPFSASNLRNGFPDDPAAWNVFLVHPQSGATYTLDDMRRYRPLPDPYPYKDDGTGLYFPDPKDPKKGRVLAEVAIEVMHRIRFLPELARRGARLWRERGDVEAARDGAIALARYAYNFPSIQSARWLCHAARDPGAYGRNLYNRRLETAAMFMTHYANYLHAPAAYDGLFDFIQGNEDLARSIGRFVPWVKTSEDVCKLIEVYLVQTTAKRILRYHYHTNPMVIAELAALLGSGPVTDPWMEFLFTRTWKYPQRPAGIQELMICGNDREGAGYIGSTFYAQGNGARRVAQSLERFKALGVLPAKYDLTNTALYPKPLAKCYWHLNILMGGRDFCRIGDVGGPDKAPGATLGSVKGAALSGWTWSKDPKFAWVIKNLVGRRGFSGSDAEWQEVVRAADTVKRAPWLDNRSRQLYNWFGALEAGLPYNDFRNRRGVYVRIGAGIGHQHNDTMDLQFYAHGLPMTIDGGQRPGYATPPDRKSRVHNLVEVNGRDHRGNAWVRALSDAEGARYMSVDGAPPAGARLFRRNVALIDANLPAPNSYIFDVFRVAGGTIHRHCFHGPLSDEVTTNAALKPAEGEDAAYLSRFARSKETWMAGDAPDTLVTTWRYALTVPGTGMGEKEMLGARYREGAPRKFTRLHLLGAKGLRVLRADAVCYKWNYRYNCQLVEKKGDDLQSAFVALYEPYAGEPFIADRRLLSVPGNETDAQRAVAVEVKIPRANNRTDLLFNDGRPEKTRRVAGATLSGEFACISRDAKGLRAAALTGGTLLKARDIEIRMPRREYTAKVTAVDYLKKRLTLDQPWPASLSGGIVEFIAPGRRTSYTTAAVAGRALTVTRGADYYRSSIVRLDPETGVVECQTGCALGTLPGLTKDFVASNDARTKFWRADILGGTRFRLKGGPARIEDFQPEGVLRLWEYGTGDTARMSTHAAVRRLEDGRWELTANSDVTVTLPDGRTHTVTAAQLAEAGGVLVLPGE